MYRARQRPISIAADLIARAAGQVKCVLGVSIVEKLCPVRVWGAFRYPFQTRPTSKGNALIIVGTASSTEMKQEVTVEVPVTLAARRGVAA